MLKLESVKKKEGFKGEFSCVLPNKLKNNLEKSILCKNLYLTDIGYYPKALYHNRERQHGCRQYILIYCVQGEGWFSIHGKSYQVKPNQFFILPENVGHHYGSDQQDPWTIYWVHFTGSLAVEYFHYLSGKKSTRPQIVFPSEERNHLFEEIIHYASMINNADAVIYANNCLYNYLASFKNAVYVKSETDHHKNDAVKNCIMLMKENLNKNLNLFEICRMMNLSVSHLSALFKERTHDSPYNYYVFLKIQRACYLLWNTQLNIKTIAAQLGYDDPYHFSRTFKNVMGLSPKQFRYRNK